MDYSDKAYSFLKLRGKIWESEYAHYSIGLKAFREMKPPNLTVGVSSPLIRRERNPSEAKLLRSHPRANARGVPRRGIKVPNSSILDIGCGAGGLTALWQKRFPSLNFEGVDISNKAIRLARKMYPEIKFRVIAAEEVETLSKKYDAVSICEVIEHLDSPEKALRNIHKILNNNGILYLTTQLEGDRRTLLGKIYGRRDIKPKEKIAGHIQIFTDRSIKKLVRESGFKITDVYYNCHFFGQINDLIYTAFLRKYQGEILSFTDNLQKAGSLTRTLGIFCMMMIAMVRNIETLVFGKRLGLGIQIIARKM